MDVRIESVVPWGRSFAEYRRMFTLPDADRLGRILGCADGPASFNAEATASGISVVSFDPIYSLSADVIRQRIEATSPRILEYARQHTDEFIWNEQIPDPESLGCQRMQAMDLFLADFAAGRIAGRYVVAELPKLPFSDNAFDLALCSHFLFLYSEQLSAPFHIDSIRELLRVAREVRIFPLTQMGATRSPHLADVIQALRRERYLVAIERVDYEFQRGGNQMLRITR